MWFLQVDTSVATKTKNYKWLDRVNICANARKNCSDRLTLLEQLVDQLTAEDVVAVATAE